MSNWSTSDLKKWDEKICKIAEGYGLDWFPIDYEICDYYEMIGHMSYHGMPSHYNHWSYGKSFERTHQLYNMGATGLPYELIINSNPSIAYLMRQNDLYLQMLIMAHCVGHSDFFKNNRMFKNTDPNNAVSMFRNAKKRIQEYSENTNIGYEKVENFLDALHSIRFQTQRYGIERKSKKDIRKSFIERINSKKEKIDRNILDKKLLEPDHDLLGFLIEYSRDFEDWQIDLIEIVREESRYFIPQISTKILNEGWASFWHYKIMHDLKLGSEYHVPFLKMHNLVVRPHTLSINPYYVGFKLFQKIEKQMGLDECFFIREIHDDVSAIRTYLEIDDFRDMNLFTYSDKKDSTSIDDISDEDGFKKVKESLIKNTGVNGIPHIFVNDISTDGCLILQHDHDGRDLDLNYADEVMTKFRTIWKGEVKLFTIIEDDLWEM